MIERLQQNYIPTNYDLYLHIIKGEDHINANVTITFKKNQDNDKIFFKCRLANKGR